MGMASRPGSRFVLGDTVFDPEDGSLTRGEQRFDLPPKQLEVLRLLVASAPRVVTREDLLDSVWADRVVGDAALTQTIKELRQALGDDARSPRFIATVAKRGYRLVAELSALPPPVTDAVGSSASGARLDRAPAAPAPGPPVVREGHVGRWWLPVALAMLAAGALLVVGRKGLRSDSARPGFTPRRAIAVLGFRDLRPAADSEWVASALSEFLSGELATGERLRVLSAEAVARVTRERELSIAALAGRPLAAPTRAALGVDLIVFGSYLVGAPAGERQLRVDVRVVDGKTGDTVLTLSDTGSPDAVLAVVHTLGAALRDRLGVGALSPAEESQLAAARPGAPEAVRLYAEGLARMRDFNFTAARELLERAAAAEPDSAVIHAALSKGWSWLGYEARESEEARRAWELSGGLPRAQQLAIEATYRERLGERERAIEIGKALFEFFPDDIEIGLGLAVSQAAAGHLVDAESTLQALRKLPAPLGDDPRIDLAEAWFSDSDLERKLAAADRAAERAEAGGARLLLAAARIQQGEAWMGKGEHESAAAAFAEALEIRSAAGDRWGVGKALLHLGQLHRDRADLDRAEDALGRFLAVSSEIGSLWSQAEAHYELGVVLAMRGRTAEARTAQVRALAFFRELGRHWGVARARLALAELDLGEGDLGPAAATAAEVASDCRDAGLSENEAAALLVLARSRLASGDAAAAAMAISRAGALLESGGDPRLRLNLALARAGRALAMGRGEESLEMARGAAAEAAGAGLVGLALEARLAAARAALAVGRHAEGDKDLAAVADAARRLGLGSLERRVEATAR